MIIYVTVSGIILVIGGVSGQVTGGWIGSKVSEVKSCVKYILGFTIIAAFFSAMLLIRSKPKGALERYC